MGNEELASELVTILDEAKRLVTEDRAGTHGNAIETLNAIAQLWRTYLYLSTGQTPDIGASDVAEMMKLMKLARKCTGKFHVDNYADDIGYGALAFAAAKWENCGDED